MTLKYPFSCGYLFFASLAFTCGLTKHEGLAVTFRGSGSCMARDQQTIVRRLLRICQPKSQEKVTLIL